MIEKAKVTKIILKIGEGRRYFIVAGIANTGVTMQFRRRSFKTYNQALRYSIQLRDYYQAPVVECSV